ESESFDFHLLFNPYGETFKKLETVFSDDVSLLKKVFFHQAEIERFRHLRRETVKKLFYLDNGFLLELLELLYRSEESYSIYHHGEIDFSFIWQQPNYDQLFKELFGLVYDRDGDGRIYWVGPNYLELCFKNLQDECRRRA